MKYIIMCGGEYEPMPRHFIKVCGEVLVERTIRLLRENGVEDIAISSNDDRFKKFGVPVLKHKNEKHWLECFYPTKEDVCYLYGDVYYSPQAMSIIVNTETTSVEFFASAPPFDSKYLKTCGEPFAYKVVDNEYFFKCIDKTLRYGRENCFWREAISWELWQVIKQTPLNMITRNYTVINDYTVDIDDEKAARKLEGVLGYEI